MEEHVPIVELGDERLSGTLLTLLGQFTRVLSIRGSENFHEVVAAYVDASLDWEARWDFCLVHKEGQLLPLHDKRLSISALQRV